MLPFLWCCFTVDLDLSYLTRLKVPCGFGNQYIDIDGTRWFNCDQCSSQFHLKCPTGEFEPCIQQSTSFVISFVAGNFKVDLDLTRLKEPCGFVY